MNLIKQSVILLFAALIITSCASYEIGKTYNLSYKTDYGFRNIGSQDRTKKRTIAKWLMTVGSVYNQQNNATSPLKSQQPNLDSINNPDPDKIQVTAIGHGSFLIQMGGLNILTDPIFSDRASPFSLIGPKRMIAPGLKISELPKIDIVLISHNHYDHLDLDSISAIGKNTLYMVPLNLKKWFSNKGFNNVREYDWWQEDDIAGLKIAFLPAQHYSSRFIFDLNESLWGSWLIESNNKKIYFAGDSGYFDGYSDIAVRYENIDVALLPIGAYEPRELLELFHMNPPEAVKAYQDLKAKYAIAMHFGVFPLSNEPVLQPIEDLNQALKSYKIKPDKFIIPTLGETKTF